MDRSEKRKIRIVSHCDARGRLFAVEGGLDVPFEIRRVFVICDVPAGAVRGEHAYLHRELVLCTRGRCRIRVWDGEHETDDVLDGADEGILIPEMTWRTLYDFSPDCSLTVLSDANYDPADYIFDRELFLRAKAEGAKATGSPASAQKREPERP